MPKKKEESKLSPFELWLVEIFGDFDTFAWTLLTKKKEFIETVKKYTTTHKVPEEHKLLLDYLMKENIEHDKRS